MAAWIPILKASLPYLTQIVATTIPAFTAKPDASKADPVTAKQIAELQKAATHNAETIRVLAEKLQQTIEGVDQAAAELQKQNARLKTILIFTTSLTVIALFLAVVGFSF